MVEAGPCTSGKTDTTHSTLVPHPIAIFIIMDIAAFGVFLVIFMVERLGDPAGFASGAARLHAGLGWINTFVLMTSGALVATAENGFRTQGAWRCWLGAGIAAGSVFAVIKLFEYRERIAAGAAGDDILTGYYFVLTGLHFAHYLVGMVLLGMLLLRRGNGGSRRASVFGAITLYWHMVDLLWLLIFPVVYLQVAP